MSLFSCPACDASIPGLQIKKHFECPACGIPLRYNVDKLLVAAIVISVPVLFLTYLLRHWLREFPDLIVSAPCFSGDDAKGHPLLGGSDYSHLCRLRHICPYAAACRNAKLVAQPNHSFPVHRWRPQSRSAFSAPVFGFHLTQTALSRRAIHKTILELPHFSGNYSFRGLAGCCINWTILGSCH